MTDYLIFRVKFAAIVVRESITEFTVATVSRDRPRERYPSNIISVRRRLLRLFQKKHPQESRVHVQGGRRFERTLPRGQDAQEPVPGVQIAEVLPGEHEQGR